MAIGKEASGEVSECCVSCEVRTAPPKSFAFLLEGEECLLEFLLEFVSFLKPRADEKLIRLAEDGASLRQSLSKLSGPFGEEAVLDVRDKNGLPNSELLLVVWDLAEDSTLLSVAVALRLDIARFRGERRAGGLTSRASAPPRIDVALHRSSSLLPGGQSRLSSCRVEGILTSRVHDCCAIHPHWP